MRRPKVWMLVAIAPVVVLGGPVLLYYAFVIYGPGSKHIVYEYPWGSSSAPVDFWGDPGPFSSLDVVRPEAFSPSVRLRPSLKPIALSEATPAYLRKYDVGSLLDENYCQISCEISRGYTCWSFHNTDACFWRDTIDHLTIGVTRPGAKHGVELLRTGAGRSVQLPLSVTELVWLFGRPTQQRTYRQRGSVSNFAR